MAGIVAAYGPFQDEELEIMSQRIKHRGPDALFSFSTDKISVKKNYLDLAAGKTKHQPSIIFGNNCVALDGKIYNSEELDPEGRFSTDEELILNLYQEKGAAFLNELDGMFALLVVTKEQKFLAARDPLGIKPLYYGFKKNTIYFASEVKALINFVDRIHIFPPGCYFTPEQGFIHYAEFKVQEDKDLDFKTAIGKIKNLLTNSVVRQIPQETTPVVLLSGGIDSSIVAALTARQIANLETFCVGMEGAKDLEAARKVAAFIGSKHEELIYTKKDIETILPQIIYYLESFDPSLIRSAIANYFAFKLIGQKAKVVFSGEGGDELFGGYAYLKKIEEKEELQHEMQELFGNLHNIGLQRVDRMSMAFSKQCRLPFLGTDLVRYALSLPPKWKIHTEDGVEKWILRKAFEGWLPDSLLWRTKQEFSQGSNTVKVMEEIAEEKISDKDFERERHILQPPLRNKEELLYYHLYRHYYDNDSAVATVGRWLVT